MSLGEQKSKKEGKLVAKGVKFGVKLKRVKGGDTDCGRQE